MAKRNVFTCDVCGKDKGEVNHWWIAYISQGVGFMIAPWSDGLANASGDIVQTLCGQGCVVKAVSEYLSKQTKEAVSK